MGMYTNNKLKGIFINTFKDDYPEIWDYILYKSKPYKSRDHDKLKCLEQTFIKYLKDNDIPVGRKGYFGSGWSAYFEDPYIEIDEMDEVFHLDVDYNQKGGSDDFKWWCNILYNYAKDGNISAYTHHEEMYPMLANDMDPLDIPIYKK